MPLYEFSCPNCGDFEVWRRLSELSNPVYCDTCQYRSKRIYSVPNVSLSSGPLSSIGRAASEEPRRVKQASTQQKPKQKTASGRPWMIGHPPRRL